jgi:hypothetical protein
LTDTGDIYYHQGAPSGASGGWHLLSTGAEAGQFEYVSPGAAFDWAGVSEVKRLWIFGVKKDGTLWQNKLRYDVPGITFGWSDTGVSDVREVSCLFGSARYYYAVSNDSKTLHVGGQRGGVAPATFTAPAGDTWSQIGGTYSLGILLTGSGRVFLHSERLYHYVPIKGARSADGSALTELDVPRPIASLSIQQTSPGGGALAFIVPD